MPKLWRGEKNWSVKEEIEEEDSDEAVDNPYQNQSKLERNMTLTFKSSAEEGKA